MQTMNKTVPMAMANEVCMARHQLMQLHVVVAHSISYLTSRKNLTKIPKFALVELNEFNFNII